MNTTKIAATLLAVVFLTACGQKGALYLPKPAASSDQPIEAADDGNY